MPREDTDYLAELLSNDEDDEQSIDIEDIDIEDIDIESVVKKVTFKWMKMHIPQVYS